MTEVRDLKVASAHPSAIESEKPVSSLNGSGQSIGRLKVFFCILGIPDGLPCSEDRMLMSYTVELTVVFSGPRPYDPPVEGSWPIRSLKIGRDENGENSKRYLPIGINNEFRLSAGSSAHYLNNIVGYSYDVLSSLSAALV